MKILSFEQWSRSDHGSLSYKKGKEVARLDCVNGFMNQLTPPNWVAHKFLRTPLTVVYIGDMTVENYPFGVVVCAVSPVFNSSAIVCYCLTAPIVELTVS